MQDKHSVFLKLQGKEYSLHSFSLEINKERENLTVIDRTLELSMILPKAVALNWESASSIRKGGYIKVINETTKELVRPLCMYFRDSTYTDMGIVQDKEKSENVTLVLKVKPEDIIMGEEAIKMSEEEDQ